MRFLCREGGGANLDIEKRREKEKEKEIITLMVGINCRGNKHVNRKNKLCPSCEELLAYAKKRVDFCPRMEDKTFCSKCPKPCYKKEQQAMIREVMRYSGPRMLLYHPILVLRHAFT